jgi:mono/diheme cytochrome c family protein
VSWRTPAAAAGAVVALAAGAIGWQREEVTTAARRAPPARDGASLFRAKGCASCHDGPDSTASAGFPSLADAGSWAGARRDGLSAEAYLAESIREPWAFTSPEFQPSGGPTPSMPELGLSTAEIDAIVAYLLAGRRPDN